MKRFGIILTCTLFVLVFLCGCNSLDDIGQNQQASECGGFPEGIGDPDGSKGDEPEYGAEWLKWEVVSSSEQDGKTVYFANENICLNCCGEHSTRVLLDEDTGVYQLAQTDAPDNGVRCFCMCVFDYAVEIPGIEEDVIQIEITRKITDSGDARFTVWEGEIDLTEGSGEIHLDYHGYYC